MMFPVLILMGKLAIGKKSSKSDIKPADPLAIIGTIISVIDEGVLIGDVSLTKDIKNAYQDDGKGGFTTYINVFSKMDFNAFIRTKDVESYYDGKFFRAIARPSGCYGYITAFGAKATVPQYEAIVEGALNAIRKPPN